MAESMSCIGGVMTSSVKDLDRWTSSLNNVLDSPRARKKFGVFLSRRRRDETETTLKFWEDCNRLLVEATQNDAIRKCPYLVMNVVPHARFRKHLEKIVEYAEENINLDVDQLQILRQAVTEDKVSKVTEVLHRTLVDLTELMTADYHLFKKDMLKEICFLKQMKDKKK